MNEIRIRFFRDLANVSEGSEPDRIAIIKDVTPEQWNAACDSKVISWTHTELPATGGFKLIETQRFAEYYDSNDPLWIEFYEVIPTPATVLGFPKVS